MSKPVNWFCLGAFVLICLVLADWSGSGPKGGRFAGPEYLSLWHYGFVALLAWGYILFGRR